MKELYNAFRTVALSFWFFLTRPRTGAEIMAKIVQKVGPFDTAKVEKKLAVRRKGRQAGLHNMPESDAVEWDPPHQAIQNHFSGVAEQLCNAVREHLSGRLQAWHLGSAKLEEFDPSHLNELGQRAHHETNSVIQSERFELQRLRKTERAFKRELNYFKAEHDLFRRATYPDSRLLHYGTIMFLVVAESALNGQFFAKGHDLGLLGGTMMAVMISLMNVLPAFWVGSVPARWIGNRSWAWKITGAAVVSGYLLAMFFMNMVVGHYRALLDSDPEQAVFEAAQLALRSGFDFGNFHSLVLFLLGIVFSLGALLKSLFADDLYPGFGKAQRRYERAQQDYQEARLKIAKTVGAELARAVDAIDRRVESFGATLRRSALELAAIGYLVEDYRRVSLVVENNCMEVANTYRDENRQVRTNPPPAFFELELRPEAVKGEMGADGLGDAKTRFAANEKKFDQFTQAAQRQKSGLEEITRKQLAEVDKLIAALEKNSDREFNQDSLEEERVRSETRPAGEAQRAS